MIDTVTRLFTFILTVTEKLKLQLIIPLIIFSLLFAKAPFSERSLIPNFEPFPDSFHYILPARCIITQGKWNLCRPTTEGRDSDVGPLYSVTLIPFFLIKNDPRMFFFANVMLAVSSCITLYLVLKKLKIHAFIQFSVLLIAITRFHLYWFPSLAMAENLILFLFLLNIWLLLTKELKFKIIGIGAALCFYAAKYAYAPLTVLFIFFHLLSIWKSTKTSSPKLLLAGIGIALVGLFLLLKSESILSLFSSTFFKLTLTEKEQQGAWFSLAFIPNHFRDYIFAILGRPTIVLWEIKSLFPHVLSVVGLLGLLWGLFKPKFRLISGVILISIVSQILFISSFYAFDGRYIIHIIYALSIGLALFSHFILDVFKKYSVYILIAIPCITLVYLGTQFTTFRYQLALNLKYAETPWYYVATKQLDSVISTQSPTEQKILITAMPVYFFDFFTSGTYVVLPVSQEQERELKNLVYGKEYNYENLPELYESLLKKGKALYLSNYGLGNAAYMHEEYALITNHFNTVLIAEGCHGACNVYKLELKMQ